MLRCEVLYSISFEFGISCLFLFRASCCYSQVYVSLVATSTVMERMGMSECHDALYSPKSHPQSANQPGIPCEPCTTQVAWHCSSVGFWLMAVKSLMMRRNSFAFFGHWLNASIDGRDAAQVYCRWCVDGGLTKWWTYHINYHNEFVSSDQWQYGVNPLTVGIDLILLTSSNNCANWEARCEFSTIWSDFACPRSFLIHQWKSLVFHDAYVTYVLECFPSTASKWSQDFCCVSVHLHRTQSQIQFEDHVVTQETVAYSSTSRAQLPEATRDGYLRDVLGVPVQRLQRSGWLAEVQFRPSGPLPHLGRLCWHIFLIFRLWML